MTIWIPLSETNPGQSLSGFFEMHEAAQYEGANLETAREEMGEWLASGWAFTTEAEAEAACEYRQTAQEVDAEMMLGFIEVYLLGN